MSEDILYVGADVAKDKIDAFIEPLNEVITVPRTLAGAKKLASKLENYANPLVVMESTASYSIFFAKFLLQVGINSAIIKPESVIHYREALRIKAKTDLMDAKLITMYAKASQVIAQTQRTPQQIEARDLCRRSSQLASIISVQKQQKSTCSSQECMDSCDRVIKTLTDEQKNIRKAMSKILKEDMAFQQIKKALKQIKGIGQMTTASLYLELDIGRMTGKQIASAVGLAPRNRQSGHYEGRAHIQGGNAWVRRLLYNGALSAIVWNPALKTFYQRKHLEENKPTKVALIAVARKLLIIANATVRDALAAEKLPLPSK